MLSEASCEICGGSDWKLLGERTYFQSQGATLSVYAQKRYRVLFDKWFPSSPTVTLKSMLCNTCGFIIYTPRPQERDIDAKYIYLNSLGNEDERHVPHDTPHELRRSQHIFRYVSRTIDLGRVQRVLDYGGADGRLMHAFATAGKQCFLVDYNQNTIPGVTKLADTIGSVAETEKFDLIVCSHVMEHVAQPLHVLKRLAAHLNDGGHVFIEVPLEVWNRAPLQDEPVTHVNFFTRASLHNLMALAALTVKTCEVAACPHASGSQRHGIRAIAAKQSSTASSQPKLLPPDAMDLLNPHILRIVRHHMYFPKRIPKLVLRKIKQAVG